MDNLVSVVGALGLSGLLGGLLGHWLGVRRERRSRRHELVAAWRTAVREAGADYEGSRSGDCPLAHRPEWLSLRRHVPERLRNRIEATTAQAHRTVVIGAGTHGAVGDPDLRAVLDLLDGLEKKWRLP